MFLVMPQVMDLVDLKLMDLLLFKEPKVKGQLYILFAPRSEVMSCEQFKEFSYRIMG